MGEMACDMKLPIQSVGQMMSSKAAKNWLDRLDLINMLCMYANSDWIWVHWFQWVHCSTPIKHNDG